MRRSCLVSLLILAGASLNAPAFAASYCVGSAAELSGALSSATASDVDDEIRCGKRNPDARGGGMNISSNINSFDVEYWLDNLIVRNNSGYFAGGIDLSLNRGLVRVVNSLFANNAISDVNAEVVPLPAWATAASTTATVESPGRAVT